MSSRTPRRAAAVAAAGVLLALAACSPSSPPESPDPGEPTPAALDRFYDQELTFGACAEYATTAIEVQALSADPTHECARLEVPLDYDAPDGEVASIALMRVPARGEAIGSLVLNTGGPGGSGLSAASTTAAALAQSPMTERFDLVGFDPRGVGASAPAVDCYSDAQADEGSVPTTAIGTTVRWTQEDTRDLAEGCAEGSGGEEVLAHLGTRDAARDMDVLREVLGDEQLTFLGQSYGTRLGAVYAEMFPEAVRAMVLDGAVDPRHDQAERRVASFVAFQRAFDQMAAFCAQQPGCPLGTDPAGATAAFQEIVRPLLDAPVPTEIGPGLDFDAAVDGVLAGLYDSQAWPVIIEGITEVQQGRGDLLQTISHVYAGRDEDGRWPNFPEANLAINCVDEERMTPQETAELRAAVVEAAPFIDPGVDLTEGARDACEAWPAEPTLGFPYAQGLEDVPPTLVVSITGDTTTPYESGAHLAEQIGGTVLTVEGEQHTVVMSGASPCVDEIASAYLVDLTVPAPDARCTL
ncbi:alpha/beta fold hydrolase [Cellulomonas triticagri]|uniref:Alpha/beta hydrolase n=1 Tax=Cellulomonas triticagri TaxID=2483352 RepID=A0A3M2JL77_9CELL|nr:alpha/beta fold hydrolase [Cellulomonas triticagri]RMI13884.1 alpha/beta hydrolase [Cellulomonas triticagri]